MPPTDIPTSTSRGKETFFDGKVFDPEDPRAYLKSLAIKAWLRSAAPPRAAIAASEETKS